jgi:multidrug resistance efflux pump
VRASNEVVADAAVVPVRNADLSLPSGGIVAEIPVAEGESVEAGQVLLRLESARQQAAVAQAEAGLARTQARLAELKAGARSEEVDAAQAAVDAAQAQVDRLSAGAKAEDIAAAQAGVDTARAGLQKVREGASEQQLIAAQTDLANAEAALRLAQAAYDRVAGDPDIGQLPQSLQLEQATNSFNAAKARLADLQNGATEADIAAAQAQVRQAQAQLDSLRAPARAAELAAAQAELRRAQAQLDLTRAGVRSETIAAAEADVASARAALQEAQAALADTELKAPFAGTVAEILPAAGEQVGPGNPVVRLADFSSWQIETDDLTELNVVQIGEGSPATIEFDALPDLELTGKVTQIKPIGVNKQGDITYTVVVVPDQTDPRLRWNMTAVVTIKAE